MSVCPAVVDAALNPALLSEAVGRGGHRDIQGDSLALCYVGGHRRDFQLDEESGFQPVGRKTSRTAAKTEFLNF